MPSKGQPSHGGKRKGAGRPRGEPTVIVSFRVPASWADKAKKRTPSNLNTVAKMLLTAWIATGVVGGKP